MQQLHVHSNRRGTQWNSLVGFGVGWGTVGWREVEWRGDGGVEGGGVGEDGGVGYGGVGGDGGVQRTPSDSVGVYLRCTI